MAVVNPIDRKAVNLNIGHFTLVTHTVVWTDYRFYSSKLCVFFPEALTRKFKTNAYMEHLL